MKRGWISERKCYLIRGKYYEKKIMLCMNACESSMIREDYAPNTLMFGSRGEDDSSFLCLYFSMLLMATCDI
jgi:hypothetical protein